ncbi:MAG: Y-family DNA polymerase [Rhodanobacteraceae bacterium]
MHWACILFPQLALDDVLRRRDDRDAPLALVDPAEARPRVQAANDAASVAGVRTGQSLAAARALCDRLAVVAHDDAAAERVHEFLAAWAYAWSSEVSRDFPDALLLEVEASFRLFGGWPNLQARLRVELDELGFRHRIALAPNPHAARVLAGAHDGIAIFDHDILRNALGELPVEQAGFEPGCAQNLRRMGLRKLGQVLDLPRPELGRRIGKDALAHLDRLIGDLAAPLTFYRPPDVFDERIELPFHTASSETLLFPLRRLLRDFAAFLASRDGGVQRFTLMFEHEHDARTRIPIGLLSAERDPALLFDIARERLDRIQLGAPVCALRLVADELPPFAPVRRTLFDTRPQQAVPWEALRERLRARLGEEAVHGIALHADHRPERAWQVDRGPRPAGEPTPNPRPAWLLRRPIPLRPRVRRVLAGPERIESGWWDGGDLRRDYYVIETDAGQRAWVFRPAGETGGFMLHGWFA